MTKKDESKPAKAKKCGSKINENLMNMSSLIKAVLDGRIDKVRNLIKSNPEMLGIRSEIGSLPYQIAVKKGLANQQTALLRAEAPGAENFTNYSDLLVH